VDHVAPQARRDPRKDLMALADISAWMDVCSVEGAVWYVKRLAANDTLATHAHQAGPYVPKDFLFGVFPSLNRPDAKNPDVWLPLLVDSHGEQARIRAVWYNNKLFGGTRNEARLTNFGGRSSALLDPESTGSLTVFVFLTSRTAPALRVWIARSPGEEDLIEERVGPVEPGRWVVWSPSRQPQRDLFEAEPPARTNCNLSPEEMPAAWLESFPSGAEIIRKAIELRPARALAVDVRILQRRKCEYEVFRSLEQAVELPRIREGFSSVDEFVARAQTVLQRRKARSGRSLELHTREILVEEGFEEGSAFSHGPESDPGKRPDFLFPSEAAYKDPAFPQSALRMLAAKTTCKDRWRQILNEAGRVPTKHLLTLQEGVSENQFREMSDAGVRLVVPKDLQNAYPAAVRPALLTLGAFLDEVRALAASSSR
jgi:hypothetical protein